MPRMSQTLKALQELNARQREKEERYAAKQAQQGESDAIEQRNAEFFNKIADRRKFQSKIYLQQGGPGQPTGGVLADIFLLAAGRDLDAASIKALFLIFFNGVELFFQFPAQQMQFARAQEMGIAYEPDEQGEYPIIYPVDQEGNFDFDQPYPQGANHIPRFAIRANGFVPPPNAEECLKIQGAKLQADLHGHASLTPYYHELVYKAFPGANHSNPEDRAKKDKLQKGILAQQNNAVRAGPRK